MIRKTNTECHPELVSAFGHPELVSGSLVADAETRRGHPEFSSGSA